LYLHFGEILREKLNVEQLIIFLSKICSVGGKIGTLALSIFFDPRRHCSLVIHKL